jgi:hypothetical protein
VERAHEFPAELHHPPVVELELLHPPADALSRLQHEHVDPARDEVARRAQPGQARAEDEDVVVAHAAAPASSRPAAARTTLRSGSPRA